MVLQSNDAPKLMSTMNNDCRRFAYYVIHFYFIISNFLIINKKLMSKLLDKVVFVTKYYNVLLNHFIDTFSDRYNLCISLNNVNQNQTKGIVAENEDGVAALG